MKKIGILKLDKAFLLLLIRLKIKLKENKVKILDIEIVEIKKKVRKILITVEVIFLIKVEVFSKEFCFLNKFFYKKKIYFFTLK